jgi:hypothetical protein
LVSVASSTFKGVVVGDVVVDGVIIAIVVGAGVVGAGVIVTGCIYTFLFIVEEICGLGVLLFLRKKFGANHGLDDDVKVSILF